MLVVGEAFRGSFERVGRGLLPCSVRTATTRLWLLSFLWFENNKEYDGRGNCDCVHLLHTTVMFRMAQEGPRILRARSDLSSKLY